MTRTVSAGAQDTTRQALLDAASEVFAEQGYAVARIRDIVARAGANLSAVNYHFGSKEGLYLAVLQHLAAQVIDRYPLVADAERGLPPEERFRGGVERLLHRFLEPGTPSRMARLLLHELHHPSAALDAMVEQVARGQLGQLSGIVAELLGPRFGEDERHRCAFSVLGQCLFYLFARPLVERLRPQTYAEPDPLAVLAQHIAGFSLAALRGLRQAREQAHG